VQGLDPVLAEAEVAEAVAVAEAAVEAVVEAVAPHLRQNQPQLLHQVQPPSPPSLMEVLLISCS
jgi:hypothetical protein